MVKLKNLLLTVLKDITARIENDSMDCSNEQILATIEALGQLNLSKRLSKVESCQYMNMSRATFDSYVRLGIIPKGQKQQGFTELSWSQQDLDVSKIKLQKLK